MYRFQLSAILLSLLARLGLAEPNYSILDENSNRWLPDDTLLSGLNSLYNGISQSLQDKDKKRKPTSVIAAAIVEYLSSDLTEEQDKLNTALNVINGKDTPKLQDEVSRKHIKENEVITRTPDAVVIEDNSVLKGRVFKHLSFIKVNYILRILLADTDFGKNDDNEQYYKYDDTDRQIVKSP